MSRTTRRRHELLADRALEGLPEGEAHELEALGGNGDDSFDHAAAAAALAELARTGDGEALPEALAEKVVEGARRRAVNGASRPSTPPALSLTKGSGRTESGRAESGRAESGRAESGRAESGRAESGRAEAGRTEAGRTEAGRAESGRAESGRTDLWLRPKLAWLAAAAAAALAVVGWLRPVPHAPEAEEARAALLAQAPDVTTVAWSATADPAARGAGGDVVWSPSRQQGFLRISGLAANDAAAAQYQLWIFDGTRDERYPVDGGVFDVRGGEVVIPIRAAVEVSAAKLFAVTVERPGGVVVSGRERIVLTAGI